MTKLHLTPLVANLPATVPFVGPESQERAMGQLFQARLGANENIFGPSPQAVQAMQFAAGEIWKYSDSQSHDLRETLSNYHDIPMNCITIGIGIDGLLGDLARLFVGPGDPVVTSLGAYPTFNYHVAGFGGDLHQVPFVNDCEDPDLLIAKARETQAKLIYISNPNNPMGTCHSAETMADMIRRIPDSCLLILDEAYVEFAPDGTAPSIDISASNVIRMRTFSKAYGMAGARIGYAVAHPDLISAFNKVRNHFGLNKLAQIGALAALQDQKHLVWVIDQVNTARQHLSEIALQNGLKPLPSATNFVTMDCGADGDFARRIVEELALRGVFIRMPFVAPQNRCIRVSAGPTDQLATFGKELPKAISAARD